MDTPTEVARCVECGKRLVGVAGRAICGRCAKEQPIEFRVRVNSQNREKERQK